LAKFDLSPAAIIGQLKEVIGLEAAAVAALENAITPTWADAVQLILETSGKVIVTGMGKSGIIAQKIAATMSSTGTVAIFLHPAEGMHGDLGVVANGDIVIALSKSGESEELNQDHFHHGRSAIEARAGLRRSPAHADSS
jgi:arabinose-5-phosphate isomerase